MLSKVLINQASKNLNLEEAEKTIDIRVFTILKLIFKDIYLYESLKRENGEDPLQPPLLYT